MIVTKGRVRSAVPATDSRSMGNRQWGTMHRRTANEYTNDDPHRDAYAMLGHASDVNTSLDVTAWHVTGMRLAALEPQRSHETQGGKARGEQGRGEQKPLDKQLLF